jgi:hypothetical protein
MSETEFRTHTYQYVKLYYSVVWVRERTMPTERLPHVGEVSANVCGCRVPRGQRDGSLRPYSRFPWPRRKILALLSGFREKREDKSILHRIVANVFRTNLFFISSWMPLWFISLSWYQNCTEFSKVLTSCCSGKELHSQSGGAWSPPLTEMGTTNLPGNKGWAARKAGDLTAICKPTF